MMQSDATLPAAFECSARRDLRVWFCLIFGIAIICAGVALSRPEACTDGCPSISTAVLQFVGGLFALFASVHMWRNASRGSKFDPATGELHWWHSRTLQDLGV
jgi:hypothetical protein